MIFVSLQISITSDHLWTKDVLYYLREILNILINSAYCGSYDSVTLEKEVWRITQGDGWEKNDNFYKVYTPDNIQEWNDDMKAMKEQILFLWPEFIYKFGKCRYKITTDAGMFTKDSIAYHSVYRNEINLKVYIPPRLFFHINQENFADSIGCLANRMNATYAAIDDFGVIYFDSMEAAPFQWYSDIPACPGPQTKLPVISWWQYITEPIGRDTGSLCDIAKECPCYKTELFCENSRIGLSIQMANNIQNAGKSERIAMRRYFIKSLYPLSISKIAKSIIHTPHCDLKDRLPLFEDEIQEINDIILKETTLGKNKKMV